jgi:hypothetical protein
MTFLNFSQLPESVFSPNFLEKTFVKTKLNFTLTGKCFPLTNFSNGKHTQKSLKNDFPKTTLNKHEVNLHKLSPIVGDIYGENILIA